MLFIFSMNAHDTKNSDPATQQYVPMKLRLQISAWVLGAAAIAIFIWWEKSDGQFTLVSAKALVLVPLCAIVLGMLWIPWLWRLIRKVL